MSLDPALLGAIRHNCDSMAVAGSGCTNICDGHPQKRETIPNFGGGDSMANCGQWFDFFSSVHPSKVGIEEGCPTLSAYAGSQCCEGYCKDHDSLVA